MSIAIIPIVDAIRSALVDNVIWFPGCENLSRCAYIYIYVGGTLINACITCCVHFVSYGSCSCLWVSMRIQ